MVQMQVSRVGASLASAAVAVAGEHFTPGFGRDGGGGALPGAVDAGVAVGGGGFDFAERQFAPRSGDCSLPTRRALVHMDLILGSGCPPGGNSVCSFVSNSVSNSVSSTVSCTVSNIAG
jgi:hypothetical protein